MPKFFVSISDEAFDRLATLAVSQRRDVRDQAAVILERWLGLPMPHESALLAPDAAAGGDDGGVEG